jgi:hypothetical protein
MSDWIKTTDRLPETPADPKKSDHVQCLIYIKGEIEIGMWNHWHLVWDDPSGDDFRYKPREPSHWQPMPAIPEA